ncbi:MAG: hypothetical protein ACRYGK_13855 [Janthinobacterium lividum]
MRNSLILRHAAAAALLLALGACGGGGGGGSDAGIPPNNMIESGQAAADSFFDQVFALVNNSSETADPTPIDGFVASTPENAAPKSF